jgi:ankyrin repeat protein
MDGKAKDCAHWTPLHAAVTKGHLEIVQWLLSRNVSVNVRDEDGLTPLCYAYLEQHLKLVQLLVKLGAFAAKSVALSHLQLHLACIVHPTSENFRFVLRENESAIGERDQHGKTPLQYACETDAPLDLIYQLVSSNSILAFRSLRA